MMSYNLENTENRTEWIYLLFSWWLFAYMQKTCDVAGKAILAKKKIAEKVRKSRQNVNLDKSA